jgi:DNA end-binding protein Ku
VAIRSIASLSLSFGLVSIPVKVYAATESSAALRFKLLSRGGARVRRQYVADAEEPELVLEDDDEAPKSPASPRASELEAAAAPARAPLPAPAPPARRAASSARHDDEAGVLGPGQIVKGYEFEKGRFVTFTDGELKELAQASRQTIDIVSFIPAGAVDPIHYDRAYFLAPDRQGTRPYSLLRAAMAESGRTALAKWAWRAKEYVVQIRPIDGGLVLQQLLYADEVRSIDALGIELAEVGAAELQLALRLIEQTSEDAYHAERFVDEEKARILAAVERKVAGRSVVAQPARPRAPSAQVIDLVAALRASLDAIGPARGAKPARASGSVAQAPRKPARRAAKSAGDAPATARPRGRQSSR